MALSGVETLMLLIYTAPFLQASEDHSLPIPFGKIFLTLLAVLIPVGLGVLLRTLPLNDPALEL